MNTATHSQPDELAISARRHVRWYYAGFCALGTLTGLIAGLSESPVAPTVLPLVFALAGAGTGAYLAKAKLASKSEQERFGAVGRSLVCFVVPCLVMSTYAILVRTGAPAQSFIPTITAYSRPSIIRPDLDAVEELDLFVLRAQLDLLGVSEPEQASVLARIYPSDAEAHVQTRVRRFTRQQQMVMLASALELISRGIESARKAHEEVPPPVVRCQYRLAGVLDVMRGEMTDASPTPASVTLFESLVSNAVSAIERLDESEEALDWLNNSGVPHRDIFGVVELLRPSGPWARRIYDPRQYEDVARSLMDTLRIIKNAPAVDPATQARRPAIAR